MRRALVIAAGLGLAACSYDDAPPAAIDAPTDAPTDVAIDAPTDANDFCSTCTADQICVQVLSGVCTQISLACEPRHSSCVGNACTPECMREQCNDGMDPPFFHCDLGFCPSDVPDALHCHGP